MMALSGGRAGSSSSLLLGRRWRLRALSAGVGLFCVTTVALFVRWLPRPYADRLGDIQAYCNALPDTSLHYPFPSPKEAIEDAVRFYLGACWYECAAGGACPKESEVEQVKRDLRERGSGPGFRGAFAFDEEAWGFESNWANVWPRFWPPSLMLYGYEFFLATMRARVRGTEFFVRFGDSSGATTSGPLPVLGKARRTGMPHSGTCSDPILFKMGRWRHFTWLTYVDEARGSPRFADKRDAAVWRGVSTGGKAAYQGERMHPRASLVIHMDRWKRSPILDVGVTAYVQGVENKWGTKSFLSRAQLAQYKMIILAEGNDVSSGLKWALLSGSAVVMPPPTIDSWARESKLVPWVHYIPVSPDFSDLEESVRWCLDHVEACEAVAKQAACNMARFLDASAESWTEREVLQRVARVLAMYGGEGDYI